MNQISVDEFKEVLEKEKDNPSYDFINVCTPQEHEESHIEGVRNVPLDTLPQHIDEFKDKTKIYIHCRSGARGQVAMSLLSQMGVEGELINVEGGIMSWQGSGYETHSHECNC